MEVLELKTKVSNLESTIKGIEDKVEAGNVDKLNVIDNRLEMITARIEKLEKEKISKFKYYNYNQGSPKQTSYETKEPVSEQITNSNCESNENSSSNADKNQNQTQKTFAQTVTEKADDMNLQKKKGINSNTQGLKKKPNFSKGENKIPNRYLQAGEVDYSYYLGSCHLSTTEKGVEQHVREILGANAVGVTEFKAKLNTYGRWKSYKIMVDRKYNEKMLDPANWPINVTIRRFWEKRPNNTANLKNG